MPPRPVIVLGAGATKACGGPLTNEILPAALKGEVAHDDRVTRVEDREELLGLTSQFLRDCFHVPTDPDDITAETCPSLPMVLSMLRRSTHMGTSIGGWEGEGLIKARRAMEYAIFSVIEATLRRIPSRYRFHHRLLEPLFQNDVEPVVVSLNYDVIVDNAMFALSDEFGRKPPDYGVDIATPRYRDFCAHGTYGHLHKIHGSLNWLYCERCHRLDLFVSAAMRTGKALDELYHTVPFDDAYSCRGTPCRNRPDCDGWVSPILITPTYVKDYENPHVDRVWSAAEEAMKTADRAVFIGYSLPSDDVEVAMLFKRGLDHLSPDRITVVEYVHGDDDKGVDQRVKLEDHPTGQRFRTLFGPGLGWSSLGFGGWLKEQESVSAFPFGDA